LARGRPRYPQREALVSIPSNGSSLFQSKEKVIETLEEYGKSLNPLKRVKFISILMLPQLRNNYTPYCLNPLKRVKFISIQRVEAAVDKEVKSQSPQTGQVYFNKE